MEISPNYALQMPKKKILLFMSITTPKKGGLDGDPKRVFV